MICRHCGNEERASEGYPCKDCGTFICIMCVFKGVVRCERCEAQASGSDTQVSANGPNMDWPEH